MRIRGLIPRILFGLLGLLVPGSSALVRAAEPEPLLFVFDLDDTLIRWVRADENPTGNLIPAQGHINGYRYRVLDGAPELIQSVLEIPGSKVAFYSGGERERNLRVLEEMKLPNGRAAIDVASAVLSKGDTVEAESAVAEGFFASKDLSRKDLRKVLGLKFPLERVILIDDNPGWALKGQEENFLWVGARPEKYQVKLGEGKQTPPEFVQDRNKLARVRGVIERMLKLSEEEGLSPTTALTRIQWKSRWPDPWVYDERLFTDVDLYRTGVAKFSKLGSSYRFVPALPGFTPVQCVRQSLQQYLKEALAVP